jgi:hypothetical protein
MTDLTKLSIVLCLCLVGCKHQELPSAYTPDSHDMKAWIFVQQHGCTEYAVDKPRPEFDYATGQIGQRPATHFYDCGDKIHVLIDEAKP